MSIGAIIVTNNIRTTGLLIGGGMSESLETLG
jgi:hypothetical protein